MAEQIYKFQPDRTLNLRGFDGFGAAAALHSTTPDSFTVSGVFRDAADFAVLVLYDADNFFEHPSIRYLPDFDCSGLKLQFKVHYSGLMPLESNKFATIDWPYLSVIAADETKTLVRLSDYAEQDSGDYLTAEGRFTVGDGGIEQYDRLTIWYQNYAFDYIAPKTTCSYQFFAGVPGRVHSVTVDDHTWGYTEKAGDGSASIAQALVAAMADSEAVNATQGDGSDQFGPAHQLNLRARRDDGLTVAVASTAGSSCTLYAVGPRTVAADLARQINDVHWADDNIALPLAAGVDGADLVIRSVRAGFDGNSISLSAVAKNDRLHTSKDSLVLSGGKSTVTWKISLDFDQVGIGSVRQAWLTFAPPLSAGPFESAEWEAIFTEWSVSGPDEHKYLSVAGPGSVRIEDDDNRCVYSDGWTNVAGFYGNGFARVSTRVGDSISIMYECRSDHDLYLGTALFQDRGRTDVVVDGRPAVKIITDLATSGEVVTRRLVAAGLKSGRHTVRLTNGDGKPVYFDFLEAAVASDVPAPLAPRKNVSPALDYSTDHTYKLSPARLLWNLDQLGFAGPMNEYVGVFWWNERVRSGGLLPSLALDLNREYGAGDQIFLEIGGNTAKQLRGQVLGKTVFPTDTSATVARHFEAFINSVLVGAWAEAKGPDLHITCQAAAPAYSLEFKAWVESGTARSDLPYTGSLQGGVSSDWIIDSDAVQILNRAARDWHADLFARCAEDDRQITVASSMELVSPPAGFAAQFPSGAAVETSVGFGSLRSTHCAFNSKFMDYKTRLCLSLCGLMASAGLTPDLQLGEICWWYFPDSDGMAFYDDETRQAARDALGRDLHVFVQPDDDPRVNGGADADFLRGRLRDFVSSIIDSVRSQHPDARFEVLFPYDVNYPRKAGIHDLGGALLRHINFPAEWAHRDTSGFDRLKMEGLDFGAWTRNLDLAVDVMRFPLDLGWPLDSVRYMIPVFNGGCPWVREYRLANSLRIPVLNFWAFDHFCIFGWDVMATENSARSYAT